MKTIKLTTRLTAAVLTFALAMGATSAQASRLKAVELSTSENGLRIQDFRPDQKNPELRANAKSGTCLRYDISRGRLTELYQTGIAEGSCTKKTDLGKRGKPLWKVGKVSQAAMRKAYG